MTYQVLDYVFKTNGYEKSSRVKVAKIPGPILTFFGVKPSFAMYITTDNPEYRTLCTWYDEATHKEASRSLTLFLHRFYMVNKAKKQHGV